MDQLKKEIEAAKNGESKLILIIGKPGSGKSKVIHEYSDETGVPILNLDQIFGTSCDDIETVMNEGCPAYVKKETITPKEASELIRKAGGKVVLAHPVAYKYEDNLDINDILSLVNETKADGIEANYIYIDRNNNKINEIDKWNNFAKEHNLFVTVGSDFHKKDGILS